ncbi:MAG: HAD family phosphatase [Vicinamibacterales bacterium]|jgi:beta-phosphoglucomutase-like phosphatase (HAD superfamily)|nr:HAD family phosphatase [Vicinamibacterales bacterium]
MPLTVILDMDGLMLDTEPISLRVWQEAGAELGYELTDDLCARTIGLDATATGRLLSQHFGPTFPAARVASRAVELYWTRLGVDGVPHKPGLQDFIRFLDQRRIAKAVGTSTGTELARRVLRAAGVLDHFDTVVGSDQVDRGKPAPDIFLTAARHLDAPPSDCLVLEDSDPGIEAAVAAGMTPILVPDLKEPAPATRRLAYAVVDSLTAARPIIEEMFAAKVVNG